MAQIQSLAQECPHAADTASQFIQLKFLKKHFLNFPVRDPSMLFYEAHGVPISASLENRQLPGIRDQTRQGPLMGPGWQVKPSM